MVVKGTGRGADQFMVRMPPGMRERIAEEAEKNKRSMNAEIVSRLEKSLQLQSPTAVISDSESLERLEALKLWIDSLRREIARIDDSKD